MNFFKRKILKLYLSFLKLFCKNDIQICKLEYYIKNNVKLNLEEPKEISEKISWLKLFHYDEKFGHFADKYESRRYVEEKVGGQILVECLGVYNSVDEIELDSFPNQFVLKGTHGSGYNLIVKDKTKLNWKKEKTRFKKWLKENYYYKFRERIYKNVQPRIIAEKYLSELDEDNLIDYKFYCTKGEPILLVIKSKEDSENRIAYYDLNWNKFTPRKCSGYLKGNIEKPKNFEELKQVASKLSENFYFVRVDLYSISNKIYFGELTFFPNGGTKRLKVEELNFKIGNKVNITELFN